MSLRLTTLVVGAMLLCGAICQAQTPAAPKASTPVADAPSNADEGVIVLVRGAGYWDIGPVYRLTIYADGKVAYLGLKNVKTLGEAEGRISREDVQRLVKEFEKIDYFSLLDEYSEKGGCPFFLWDSSNALTSLNVGGKKKRVFHDLGCLADDNRMHTNNFPRGLTELEDLIDEIAKSKQWIK
jgi:hypothetical protein